MKCQYCANPATVHLTEIINKQKKELHLCEACARQNQLIPPTQQDLNIPALLKFLIEQPAVTGDKSFEGPQMSCPACGMKYAQFRAQGRLGCPADYEAFRSVLERLLYRIHRKTTHKGKVPSRWKRHNQTLARVELEALLKEAIAVENYEEAARLRDRIRSIGATDEPR